MNGRRIHPPAPRRRAFTLIEILIVVVILGILAAIVVPQFSNATHAARENALKDVLRYFRTQVAVYKAQHRDVAPGYPLGNAAAVPASGDLANQMTLYSNDRSATSATGGTAHPFGPYFQKMPINPITGLNTVLLIQNGQAMPKTYQGSTYGWIYKPQTLEIVANSDQKDGNGVAYMDY